MPNPSPHPLDPYSAEELTAAVAILTASGNISAAVRYSCALPVEPDKSFVRNYTAGEVYDRQVRLLGYDVELAGSFDALISIDADRVVEFQTVTRGQSPLSFMDFIKVIQTVKADENWQAAMRKRGIDNFDLVQIDPWPAGGFLPPEAKPGARVMRAICFERKFPADNGYAHPIHGVMPYVDIDAEKVIRLDDHGVVPIPPEHGNYDVESSGPMREDLRPIEITQPEGTSFSVEGSLVRWQKWQFRVSLHAIHGPVLHDVGYEDQGRLRPILHRASLSDMVVPYGDSSPMHAWKHVLDASELGLGQFANSLKLGCDCLGEIHYLDATRLNWNGEPVTVENAICMHEEDYGILWKHFDLHANRTEVRRSRRLVVSSIHTVGNYEYGLFWYLYLDGTIQFEVKTDGHRWRLCGRTRRRQQTRHLSLRRNSHPPTTSICFVHASTSPSTVSTTASTKSMPCRIRSASTIHREPFFGVSQLPFRASATLRAVSTRLAAATGKSSTRRGKIASACPWLTSSCPKERRSCWPMKIPYMPSVPALQSTTCG